MIAETMLSVRRSHSLKRLSSLSTMAEAYIPTSGNNKGYIKIITLKWGTKYYRFFFRIIYN